MSTLHVHDDEKDHEKDCVLIASSDCSRQLRNLAAFSIVWLGVLFGVQTMFAGFLFWGAKPASSAQQAPFTDWGRELFHPERDIPIYLAFCVLTCLLCSAMLALWNRRLCGIPDEFKYSFMQPRATMSLALAALTTPLNYTWFFKAQRLCQALHLPSLPAAIVLLMPVCIEALFWIAILQERPDMKMQVFRGSGFGVRALPFLMRPEPPATSSNQHVRYSEYSRFYWPDVLALLLVCAIVYSPRVDVLAGYIFQTEHFHHWDYFIMGPALGYVHGQALHTQVYSQYGSGFPVLFALLNPLYTLSYGHILQFTVVYACLYFWGAYLFLRILLRSPFWAMFGTLLLIYHKLFIWTLDWLSPWQLPSNTILRAPFDIWFLLALLLHQRSRSVIWFYLAGALTGLSLLFETDTGIYITFTFGIYSFLSYRAAFRAHVPGSIRAFAPSYRSAWLWTSGVFLAGMAIASRGTLFQIAFWRGWLECFTAYPAGISMMPVSEHKIGMMYGMVIVGVYLFALCYNYQCLNIDSLRADSVNTTLADSDTSQSQLPPLLLLCTAVYGACTLIHYMGRSHPSNLYVGIMGYTLLFTVGLYSLTNLLLRDWLRRLPPRRAALGAVLALALLYGVMWKRDMAFRVYPNALRLLTTKVEPREISLYKDAAGRPIDPRKDTNAFFIQNSASEPLPLYPNSGVSLPRSFQSRMQQYLPAIEEMKAQTARHKTVAILANDETWLYVASGAPLWYRYTPLFPNIITLAQRENLKRELAAKSVDYVYIEAQPPVETFVGQHPLALYTTDTWRELKLFLPQHYIYDHRVGLYEVWRR